MTPGSGPIKPQPYVVKGLLGQGNLGAIIGAPGAGKSLLGPRLAFAVAQGQPFFGRKVRQGKVFYVAAEDTHGMQKRLSALRNDLGDADDLRLVDGVFDLLSKGGQLKELVAAVKAERPSLVIIDTLAVAFPGLEENDAKGMGTVVAAAKALTRWGAAVVLIHHDTKAGDGLPRGHSLLNGALDVPLYLKREKDGVIGKPSKNRNGPTEQTIAFIIATRVVGTDEDGDDVVAPIAEEADAADVESKGGKSLPKSSAAALSLFHALSDGDRGVLEDDWRKTAPPWSATRPRTPSCPVPVPPSRNGSRSLPDDLTRSATARANSYNPETRQFQAVIATEAPVQRRDARGPYLEILSLDGFTPPIGTLPLLDSHRHASVRDQLGRVLSIVREGDALVATLELSSAEDVAPVGQRIADGTTSGVSIGYGVGGWQEQTTPAGRDKRAVCWALSEVTLTSNPADPSARIRQQEESPMPDPIETITPEAAAATRCSEIRTLTRNAGAPAEVADQLIDSGADMTGVRAALFDHMQTRRSTTPIIRSHTPANDDPAVIRDRMADALHVRMAGGTPAPEVRQFMSMSLMDVAKDSLGRAGISTRGMSNDEVLTRAGEHTTSDFALVVSNAANKTAMASYQAAQSPLKQLGRQRSLSNFKTSTAIRLGEMGRLEELAESGEITHTSRAENGESLVLKTYARAITVSRNLIINDDLNLLGDMTAAFGEAAADTERDIMTDLITGNPNLSDGNPVFSTARGNTIASGVSLGSTGDTAALDDARKAMRGFKGLDGKTLINVTPRYLLVGPAGEAAAERFLASIYPATSADAQSGMAKLTLLVEPRIEDESWYIFADPARVAALQYGYLSSAQGVQIQRAEAWDTLGLKFRAWLDFGAGWLDWRAAYLNPGD